MRSSSGSKPPERPDDEPVLIRKYSSRRLYDPAAGRFVTLDDLYELIRRGRHIKAVDAGGRDITRSILLQVLADREERGRPLLSTRVLHEMVRLYGDATHSLFERFLEEGIEALLRQQAVWRSGVEEAMTRGTSAAMARLFEQNLDLWRKSGEIVFGKPPEPPEAAPPRRTRRRK